MSLATELKALTPEGFEKLPKEKRDELIEYNDEFVREWRAKCQLCGTQLRGTRASIRSHVCDDTA